MIRKEREWLRFLSLPQHWPAYAIPFALAAPMVFSAILAEKPAPSGAEMLDTRNTRGGGSANVGIIEDREQAMLPPTLPNDHGAALVSTSSKFSLGDHLKIVFFESLETGNDDRAASQMSRLIERTELTGVYVVNQSGDVLLPLIGSVEVEGVSVDRAVQNLQTAYRQTFDRDCKVSIATVQREPIYFVGKGLRSGYFDFTPGMIVLHAVALSGASEGQRPEIYLRMEYVREQERLAQSINKLKRQLASLAVLRAETSGKPVRVPVRLTELAGEKEAEALTAEAERVREIERASQRAQIVSLQAAVAAARGPLGSYKGKLAIIERQIASKKKGRGIVDDLREKGMASSYLYYETDAEVADIEQRKYEAVSGIAEARLQLEQAERNLAKLEAEHRLAMERKAHDTTAEIQILETEIAGSRRLIADFEHSAIDQDGKSDNYSFEIIRRTRKGLEHIKATETTELVPGDLLRVSPMSQLLGGY